MTHVDIVGNLSIVLFYSLGFLLAGTAFIRRSDEDTEYTKNVKLSKLAKTLLLLSYKGDKIEMEAVIHNALLIILTIVLSIISFYKIIPNSIFVIVYSLEFFGVLIGCMIYRFKTGNFKDSKDHYE